MSISEHVLRKLKGHARKWNDLPVFPHSIELPSADGDISQLEELADRILDTQLPDPIEDYWGWHHQYRLLDFAAFTELSFHMEPWPEDEAAALIEAWKAA